MVYEKPEAKEIGVLEKKEIENSDKWDLECKADPPCN